MKNSSETIGNRARDLPTCSLNQLRHRVPPIAHIACYYSYCYFIFVKNWVWLEVMFALNLPITS